ncbi:hypothetical protein HAX54_023877 [Datura stramonium]|uniref:Bromo domain-containing protein n=1 Tax=Datura stramonium TaxID=4076 RepID=A0ABS8RK26_DATST|nr:hypothetical protein [Datura stramonium]
MEKLREDMCLACSVQRYGLENWPMVAAKFSSTISGYRRCAFHLSPTECQVRYENLKEHFKSQADFNEGDDDERAFIKFMTDKLKETYRAELIKDVKRREASTKKCLLHLCKLEAERRIETNEEEGDKSNDKILENTNINRDFIKILDKLKSHKHYWLFESPLPSQENAEYIRQIKQHMDLQIIQNKLEQDAYSNLKTVSFFRDLLLMFNNAIVYYPEETLQHSAALELRAIVVREMGKKPLFPREIVCGLAAVGNPIPAIQKLQKRIYNARSRAQQVGESSVRRSERLKNKPSILKNEKK